ncbi:MAG: ATP-dependent RNA helicase HrpA [Planctomycetia bacterium]|nr:ATP-dependent RNA helicase HrpA [Planctomycetia bacterium]
MSPSDIPPSSTSSSGSGVDFRALSRQIGRAMTVDQFALRRQLDSLRTASDRGREVETRLAQWRERLARSIALLDWRRKNLPAPVYDESLPVSQRRQEIATAIREHQVVILCGETGSGKSTQLPKICLELGRGVHGLIGHTQPRRLAARSIAARIAEELHSPPGRAVGYKVRFAEEVSEKTFIQVMTDGILLVETQTDPRLEKYDTLIIDEAHERSLNIDFLIGITKRLLPKRPDLKLIITSATLDAERFASHFPDREGNPAPILRISGRTYPVEIRWRPPEPDEEGDLPEPEETIANAVEEAASLGPGDILVFLPTERDIHALARVLRGRNIPGDGVRKSELFPLYARLSIAEQRRVFEKHTGRRIVLSTNVAESSLTVPGIRYVIDPGTVRLSRYSSRTKTQRLPIEPVSRASADQRAGRCGRVGPGVCIRLYSEQDYMNRPAYTQPEILRSNLASVILRTRAFRLGAVETFPFLDPPRPETIRDGYRTLYELGAIDASGDLTSLGRRLSRLPLDPRIGRILCAAEEYGCLSDALVIAAVLELQDPRERPHERASEADAQHAPFTDPESDFLSALKLWDFYVHLRRTCSGNQLRKACVSRFLNPNRMREWSDIRLQLQEIAHTEKMNISGRTFRYAADGSRLVSNEENEESGKRAEATGTGFADFRADRRVSDTQEYRSLHQAILTGFLSNIAYRDDGKFQYSVGGGGKAVLWPGSGLFREKPIWCVCAEQVETSNRYLRTIAKIQPSWIEPIADHLVRRTYSNVHWSGESGSAMATEKVTLYGLPIVRSRTIRYGKKDPEQSRALMIQNGLVEGDWPGREPFYLANAELLNQTRKLEAKLRRRDLVCDDSVRYRFYADRIPETVYDIQTLTDWRTKTERRHPRILYMNRSDVQREDTEHISTEDFPDTLNLDTMRLPLVYRFSPGEDNDGITVEVPSEALPHIDGRRLGWIVPGLLSAKIEAMIRSLPKQYRVRFVPVPDTVRKIIPDLKFGHGDFSVELAALLSRYAGISLPASAFDESRLPPQLKLNVRISGAKGDVIAENRDLTVLRAQFGERTSSAFAEHHDPKWERDGMRGWEIDGLPEEVTIHRSGLVLKAYPALVDHGDHISMRLFEQKERSVQETDRAVRRLLVYTCGREISTQTQWFPKMNECSVWTSTIRGFDLRSGLTDLIAERAMAGARLPRSRQEFDDLIRYARKRIPIAVQELAGFLAPMAESYHRAGLSLKECSRYPKWRDSVTDALDQIESLVSPGFMTHTPWEWLRHYPRYFRGISIRMESLRGGGESRDRRGMSLIAPLWSQYTEHHKWTESQGLTDPELYRYRWMLEEYRISLFAQRLGTAVTVSPKRLAAQWEKTMRRTNG